MGSTYTKGNDTGDRFTEIVICQDRGMGVTMFMEQALLNLFPNEVCELFES